MKKSVKPYVRLHLHTATQVSTLPSRANFLKWVRTTLKHLSIRGEITIRIVNAKESAALNKGYRRKEGPTNVLAFPFNEDKYSRFQSSQIPYRGDIVICAPLVKKEAKEQDKLEKAHWAHLTIHATLHLLGYDHIKEKQARKMEGVEILLLESLGFDNPYL